MAILFGLLSALAYGSSDFIAGLMTRRAALLPVAVLGQSVGLLVAVGATAALFTGWPSATALGWGALSGLGSGTGTLALYRGLAVGRMSVVAPLSGVGAALIPAVLGLALGEPLSLLAVTGIALALPAIVLVSIHGGGDGGDQEPAAGPVRQRTGAPEGLASGAGFALLFIGLARAGTGSGGWPLLTCQGAAVGCLALLAVATGRLTALPRRVVGGTVLFGALGGLATLFYLIASGLGYLSVVAVLSSLYPAVTVVCARVLLAEHWSRVQLIGLGASAAAVALIALG